MKTVRLTMAQALVRFLENQYMEVDGAQHRFVRGVFIIPGHGNVVGLGQALSQEAKHLEIYQGKNEQGMAQAAVAFAKQMKRKQICVATSSVGPGAANMVTACGTATANNIPLLVLPGDTYACRQPDPVLQQVEHTNSLATTTNDAFKAVCRYWDRVVRPEQLMSAMINAFRVLTDPANTGAVCVAMPQDVEGEAYDYPVSFFAKRVWRLERRPATEAALADAAEAIRKAKRPMMICGGGVRYSEAHAEFLHFAETFGIPYGETQAGKSATDWLHPLNLGGVGTTGCSAANEIARKADLVIGVGTRYTDFTTASKWLFKDTWGTILYYTVGVLSSKLLALMIVKLFAHKYKKKDIQVNWKLTTTFLILPVITLTVGVTIIGASKDYNDRGIQLMGAIGEALLVFANLAVFYLFESYGTSLKKQYELESNEHQMKLEYEYLNEIISRQTISAKEMHDLKNQLYAIRDAIKNDDAKGLEMIDGICKTVNSAQEIKYTTNSAINALINSKKKLMNGAQMKRIDVYSIQEVGIPSLVLMERAALCVTEAVLEKIKKTDKVLCVCGSGNNGADGMAVARQLTERGISAEVYTTAEEGKGTEELNRQRAILQKLGMVFVNDIPAGEYNCIIDAVFR